MVKECHEHVKSFVRTTGIAFRSLLSHRQTATRAMHHRSTIIQRQLISSHIVHFVYFDVVSHPYWSTILIKPSASALVKCYSAFRSAAYRPISCSTSSKSANTVESAYIFIDSISFRCLWVNADPFSGLAGGVSGSVAQSVFKVKAAAKCSSSFVEL